MGFFGITLLSEYSFSKRLSIGVESVTASISPSLFGRINVGSKAGFGFSMLNFAKISSLSRIVPGSPQIIS